MRALPHAIKFDETAKIDHFDVILTPKKSKKIENNYARYCGMPPAKLPGRIFKTPMAYEKGTQYEDLSHVFYYRQCSL